jgi:cytidylate kinase
MNREFAPLKQAEDAIYLDSSDMTIDEVVEKIICFYHKKLNAESVM